MLVTWHIWLLVAIIVFGVMGTTASLLQGLALDSLTTIGVLAALWVCAIWLLRRWWMYLLLLLVCIPPGIGMPFPFLSKVELLAWVMATIGVLVLLEHMVRGGTGIPMALGRYAVVWIVLGAVVVRVAVDMPGSTQFGNRGGLSIAVSYVMGVLAFPAGLWAGYHAGVARGKSAALFIAGGLGYAVYTICGLLLIGPVMPEFRTFLGIYRGYMFEAPAWLIAGTALTRTLACDSRHSMLRGAVFAAVSLAGMAVALVSIHRAFVIYALLIPFVVAWAYRAPRLVVLPVTVLVLTLGAIVGMYKEGAYVPEYMRRPLSILTGNLMEGRQGEYGWENDFRAQRTRELATAVKQRPLVGRGFSYSTAEAERELATAGHFALVQSYHNSFFTVTGACGLPVGIALVALIAAMTFRLAMWARSMTTGETKAMVVALLSFLVVSLLQASVQGGGLLLGRCMLLLGLLRGIKDRSDARALEPAGVPPGDIATSR